MKTFLSGNEAVARGTHETGAVSASTYAGTEILEAGAQLAEGKMQRPPDEEDFRHRVLLPSNAGHRHPIIEDKLLELQEDTGFAILRLILQRPHLDIITSGVAYQHAREVFPDASFLKPSLTRPLPRTSIQQFARQVERIYVIEELDPPEEEQIRATGIPVTGKEIVPRAGELDPGMVRKVFQADGNGGETTSGPVIDLERPA